MVLDFEKERSGKGTFVVVVVIEMPKCRVRGSLN